MNKSRMLYYAHEAVLMRWLREIERIENNPTLEMPIAHYKAEKYRKELDEIETEMKALEMEEEQT